MLSFLEAPKGFIQRADIHRKRMVWQEIDDKKRFHLVNWHTVCLPKDCGGLGVLDLTTMNEFFVQMAVEAGKYTRDLANNA
jgi:hypothetical protein